MNYFDMLQQVNEIVEQMTESMTLISAEQLGLDHRAGHWLYINRDCIAVREGNAGSLNYYGGFEYVDPSLVSRVGNYVFYSAESNRVQECIDRYYVGDPV